MEEHATLHGIRLFKCPRNDNNNNDDVFLLNILTTVPQGHLSEYFLNHQCVDNYHSMKNFSIRWDHNTLITEKVLHDKIANSNIFQSYTDLKMVRDIHDYMRSLFRYDNSTRRTDSVLVWVIDIQRYEFTQEYLGDNTDSDYCTSTTTTTTTTDAYSTPCPTDKPFTDVNCILEYLKTLRNEDLSLKLVEVGPLIETQILDLELVPTQDGYRHVVAENGVEGCCSICWEGFQGEVVAQDSIYKWLPQGNSWSLVRLKCGHEFHHRCIFNWLPRHPTCPYCRSSTLTFF